nr:TPA_asm: movement protein [Agrostis ophiovirus_agro]
MQNISRVNNLTVKENNLIKIQVHARLPLAMGSTSTMNKMNSSLFNGKEEKSNKELVDMKAVKFSQATDQMVEEGVTILASLNTDGAISPEVECMAAEFKDAIKGKISSVVSPMKMTAESKEGSKKVKLGTMDNLKTIIAGHSYPFYRIVRLKILYLPLFSRDEAKEEKITFSINDTSVKVGNKSKSISSISTYLNKMSMIELYADHFIPSEHLSMIEFNYKVKRVPVKGRAFGFMVCCFYIQGEYLPITYEFKKPISLLIDDIELPKDINKTSSLKGIVNTVNRRIENNKERFEKAEDKYDQEEEERKSSMRFTGSMRSLTMGDEKIRSSSRTDSGICIERMPEMSEIHKISEKNISDYLPRRLPFIHPDKIALDTGAPDHWFYYPGLINLSEKPRGAQHERGITYYNVKGVEIKLGQHWVKFKEICYSLPGDKPDFPLISYKKLQEGGIIDSMQSYDKEKTAVLCKDGKVIFELDCSGHYMVFKTSDELSLQMLVESG